MEPKLLIYKIIKDILSSNNQKYKKYLNHQIEEHFIKYKSIKSKIKIQLSINHLKTMIIKIQLTINHLKSMIIIIEANQFLMEHI